MKGISRSTLVWTIFVLALSFVGTSTVAAQERLSDKDL